jgi:inorganic pyrophosphatase
MSGDRDRNTLEMLLAMRFAAHPWHGVPIGDRAPEEVTVYVEIVPTDAIKYELDKGSGHLRIDRPQLYSSFSPTLYGFIPQTYCGHSVGQRCAERTGRANVEGDHDPMDICVLSERDVSHSGVLLRARPIGGLRMIDGNEADDKIIAVLHNDGLYGSWQDLSEIPPAVVNRIVHYFETYKLAPGAVEKPIVITHVFGREEAHELITRAQADYHDRYGYLEQALAAALENRAEFREP